MDVLRMVGLDAYMLLRYHVVCYKYVRSIIWDVIIWYVIILYGIIWYVIFLFLSLCSAELLLLPSKKLFHYVFILSSNYLIIVLSSRKHQFLSFILFSSCIAVSFSISSLLYCQFSPNLSLSFSIYPRTIPLPPPPHFRLALFLSFWGILVLMPTYMTANPNTPEWERYTLSNVLTGMKNILLC